MHWLPLVAMVIASALPFPHRRVSRVAVATTEPSSVPVGGRRDEQPPSLVVLPVKPRAPGNVLDVVLDADAAPQEVTAHVQGPVGGQTSGPGTRRPETDLDYVSHGGMLRTEELSLASSKSTDRTGPSGHQHLASVDLSDPERPLDSAPQEKRGAAVTSEAAEPSAPPGTGALAPSGRGEQNLNQEAALSLDRIFDREEMLLDIHPRVLFSTSSSPPEHPPLLLMLESGLPEEPEKENGPSEGHGDRAPDPGTSRVTAGAVRPRRDKRSVLFDRRRGELSVCESESNWMNKSTAVDMYGYNVSVMMEIQTQKGPLKQFFYETRCRRAEPRSSDRRSKSTGAAPRPADAGAPRRGCLGVDKKQWESECKVKQSFVRALTKDEKNKVSWRWIRIDSSCVCVLFRPTQVEGRARGGRG